MPINGRINKQFLDKPYRTWVVTMATQATGLPQGPWTPSRQIVLGVGGTVAREAMGTPLPN